MLYLFSDDSGGGTDRYRSLALVAVQGEGLETVRSALAPCFSATRSVEWKDLTGDSRKQACARALTTSGIQLAARGTLIITVLSWDHQDTRHSIPGRDDLRNIERMYHHAIAATARKRGATTLSLQPDETSEALDFRSIQAY